METFSTHTGEVITDQRLAQALNAVAECKEKLGKVQGNIPRTSLDRYGEIAYRTAYNPDYATPWDKLSMLTKRKYKAIAKAVLIQAGAEYVE